MWTLACLLPLLTGDSHFKVFLKCFLLPLHLWFYVTQQTFFNHLQELKTASLAQFMLSLRHFSPPVHGQTPACHRLSDFTRHVAQKLPHLARSLLDTAVALPSSCGRSTPLPHRRPSQDPPERTGASTIGAATPPGHRSPTSPALHPPWVPQT